MAKDIVPDLGSSEGEFYIEIEDAVQEPQAKSSTTSIVLPTIPAAGPQLIAVDTSKVYQASTDGRKKKGSKKRTRKKSSSTTTQAATYDNIKLKRPRRQTIYRIDTSTTIYLYANRRQAELAEQVYDRDAQRILQHEYYIKLRGNQKLKLHGIRPGQVQVMADGSVAIQLTIVEKRKHSYSAVYTVDSFEEVLRKVREGVPGATLGYVSKSPAVLRHILDCLNVHYTESEFTTLVAKLNDSIRYDEQVAQQVRYSRKNIFFSKRVAKSDRLLTVRTTQEHRPARRQRGRAKKSARLLGPERRA